MNNQVVRVSPEEMDAIKAKIDKDTIVAEIDGKNIPDLSRYFEFASNLFGFPRPAKNFDGYNDWMGDFTWTDQKDITIIIYNINDFMKMDLVSRDIIIRLFWDSILPWWEGDIVGHVVGGKPRKFMVYLVDCKKRNKYINNQIVRISPEEMEAIKAKADKDTLVAEIDGKNISELPEYLKFISDLFSFPTPAESLEEYSDRMCDLTWIAQRDIIIMISNFEKFMNYAASRAGDRVIGIFWGLLLPWWESEVVNHVVGGKPRKFMVYLAN